MLATELSKDQKAWYYSLIDGIGVKDLRVGNILECPDTTVLQQRLNDHNIDWMVADELGYHFKFLKVPSKPYIVYTKGNQHVLDMPLLGIVGPRRASSYAQGVMKDFFSVLSQYRVGTISWWAPGIDTMCHELSLQYDIPTVVVLGWGLGHYVQQPNTLLLDKVVDAGGLVLSEFKLKQVPTNYTFPQRNRIIAGLSDVLFVPAAGQKSGSLITVDFALQIHTTVYTVPASLHEVTSIGSNTYLAEEKMRAVVDYEAMLDKYFEKKDHVTKKTISVDLSPQQTAIMSYLQEQGTRTIEQIADHTDITPSLLLADMTILEMYACIREEDPGHYMVI